MTILTKFVVLIMSYKLLKEVYRTQGAEGSQPAMKTRRNEDMGKMNKIKDVSVHVNVMYKMCACYYCVL
jgi:hypothetical protein